MAYPSSLDNLTASHTDGETMASIHATTHNALAAAINAVEAELGLLPKGAAASVRARLDSLDYVTPSVKTANYTLTASDNRSAIEMNSASPTVVTVPPNSVVPLPVGATIRVFQYGAGSVTIAPGSGVTLRSYGGNLLLAGQFAEARLRKRATDEWVVDGNLIASSTGGGGTGGGGGTASAIQFGTSNNVGGGGSQSQVLAFFNGSVKEKWIREDSPGSSVRSFATANGIKVIAIVYNNPSDPGVANGDMIELGNEPYFTSGGDGNWGGTGDPAAWAVAARNAAKAIKIAQPLKKILLPLLVQVNNGDIFTGGVWQPMVTVLQNATASDPIWQYVDGYAIHPYGVGDTTPLDFSVVDHIRSEVNAITLAAGKLFYATEWGWTTGGAAGTFISEAQQNTQISAFVTAWKARTDAALAVQYRLADLNTADTTDREQHFGILHSDGSTKPAYANYRTAATT